MVSEIVGVVSTVSETVGVVSTVSETVGLSRHRHVLKTVVNAVGGRFFGTNLLRLVLQSNAPNQCQRTKLFLLSAFLWGCEAIRAFLCDFSNRKHRIVEDSAFGEDDKPMQGLASNVVGHGTFGATVSVCRLLVIRTIIFDFALTAAFGVFLPTVGPRPLDKDDAAAKAFRKNVVFGHRHRPFVFVRRSDGLSNAVCHVGVASQPDPHQTSVAPPKFLVASSKIWSTHSSLMDPRWRPELPTQSSAMHQNFAVAIKTLLAHPTSPP